MGAILDTCLIKDSCDCVAVFVASTAVAAAVFLQIAAQETVATYWPAFALDADPPLAILEVARGPINDLIRAL